MGRDYSPNGTGTSEWKFLGCFTGLKGKRRTKRLILSLYANRETALRSSEVNTRYCSNDCSGFTVLEFVYGVYI